MDGVQAVEQFLGQYGPDYLHILDSLRRICTDLKSGAFQSAIDDVYSRASDPANTSEFKSAKKIASKVFLRTGETHAAAFLKLNDIVGLTVVVRYPDQIAGVRQAIQKAVERNHMEVEDVEEHTAKNGYYATHMVCVGHPRGEGLRCEIQIKTMLHNAWGAKMHDLTYKPSGVLDPRMERLMSSIADTIQSLEVQSSLIRDLITANWDVEQEIRQATRKGVFESMLRYSDKLWGEQTPEAFREIGRELDMHLKHIEGVPANHRTLVKLMKRIDGYCEDKTSLRFGWILAGRLASHRRDRDLTRFFTRHAERWLSHAPTLLNTGEIDPVEVRAVPLVYYVLGDLEAAITQTERLLKDAAFAALSLEDRMVMNLNRANYLIELEYHQPTRPPDQLARLKEEVEQILREIEAFENADQDFRSCVMDTRGLYKITFGGTSRAAGEGLLLCRESHGLADQDDHVAQAYLDLNMRLGWRRLFDLELRERIEAKAPAPPKTRGSAKPAAPARSPVSGKAAGGRRDGGKSDGSRS